MKKLIVFLSMIFVFGCTLNSQVKPVQFVDQRNYIAALVDSVKALNDSVQLLNESIVKLNQRPLMTSQQFIILYKYDRLLKYYRICLKNSSQWKFYKGWSIRVFTE